MAKEKVVLFLDYANINRATRENGCRLDYHHLLNYMGEERFLVDAYAYIPINPRNEHRTDGVIEELWRSGYIVTTKLGNIAGGTYKCNFDVEIAMDMLRTVYQVKPDIIVLASGDSDFVPLIQEVRKAGVRVEVAAFVETSGADILRKCSGFIDLAVYYESYLAEQRAEQNEERIEEQYQELIQSQNGKQSEGRITEQEQDLIQPQESALNEKDAKSPAGQINDETGLSVSDIINELVL
jgi:uncharacterized LabA/DUF88 family protein